MKANHIIMAKNAKLHMQHPVYDRNWGEKYGIFDLNKWCVESNLTQNQCIQNSIHTLFHFVSSCSATPTNLMMR